LLIYEYEFDLTMNRGMRIAFKVSDL